MIPVQWLGRVPYRDAWRWMKSRRETIVAGRAEEVFWMMEHDPVITLGRRGGQVLELGGRTPVIQTERGGLATWHGPGQLVGYPLVHLQRRQWKVREFVAALEEGLINWLKSQSIEAGRRDKLHGVWVGDEKVASIGLHLHQGVSIHGFSLNLQPDLTGFSEITPCGISKARMTSVYQLSGANFPLEATAKVLGSVVLNELAKI